MYGKHHSEETRRKISEYLKKDGRMAGKNNPNYGKHHSDDTKKKISERLKKGGKLAGKNNPMYGNTRFRGENSSNAKLTNDKAREIKVLIKENKLNLREIAKIYNVSPECISAIKNNRTWINIQI